MISHERLRGLLLEILARGSAMRLGAIYEVVKAEPACRGVSYDRVYQVLVELEWRDQVKRPSRGYYQLHGNTRTAP